MDKVVAVKKEKYPADVMFTLIGALCIVAGIVCFALSAVQGSAPAGFWIIASVLVVCGAAVLGWILWDFISYRKLPQTLVEIKDDRYFILGQEVEKSDIKQFNYSQARGRKDFFSWGTLVFVLSDGKELKCRFAENVKEAYIDLMKLVRGLSFDDGPSAEEILHG